MAQRVWRDLARQTGEPHGALEALLYRCNRLTIELDETDGDKFAVPPAAQVREQPGWYGRWRLALFGGPLADRLAVEDAALEVDIRPSGLGIGDAAAIAPARVPV